MTSRRLMARTYALYVICSLVHVWAAVAFARSAHASDADLKAFVEAHICMVDERLHMIRAAPRRADGKDRFLSVSSKFDADRYAQCIFFDGDKKVLCEAASGFYSGSDPATRRLKLTPEAVKALAKLGYDTSVETGNFRLERTITSAADVRNVAVLLLESLYHGYGLRAGQPIELRAKYGHLSQRCAPTS